MDDDDVEDPTPIVIKRKRGRPTGSKNKQPLPMQVPDGPRLVPPGFDPMDDYRHADPLTMVSRQYAMLDWAQQALRVEMKKGLGNEKGIKVSDVDVAKLLDISNSMMRTMEAHKRALALAEELSKQKPPAEILRICINKIKGQDLPTLTAIIRELREHRAILAPITKREAKQMDGTYKAAVLAIAELGEEPEEL